MKLSQLQYFEVICKYSNITKASEVLHVSQPTLSGVINELEKEFGVTLFYRQRNGIKITEDGEKLLELSKTVTVPAENLIQKMRERGNANHTVRMGVPIMTGTVIFPIVFRMLQDQYPDTKLEITEAISPDSISMVSEGLLDAAIASCDRPLPAAIESITICKLPIRFYMSIDNPLAYMTELDYATIKDTPLVMFSSKTTIYRFVMNEFSKHGITPNIILYSGNLYAIRNLLNNNSASAFLYDGILDPKEENIACIPLPGDPRADIRLIWNRNHNQSTGLKNLIKMLKNNPIEL